MMPTHNLWTLICRGVFTAALVAPTWAARPALAQRRGEQGSLAKELMVQLPVAVRFGDKVLPARRYRVNLADHTLLLADPETMEVLASLPAAEGRVAAAATPHVDVTTRGAEVFVILIQGDRSYTVQGQKGPAQAAPAESDVPTHKTEKEVSSEDETPPGPAAQVSQAVQRYLPSLATCIDGAQKAHWITDDPHFANCVCPQALKWHMPHLAAPLRMHQKLVSGKFGMSFTVTPDGRVTQCRVWAGARSPETARPAAAPAQTEPPATQPVAPAQGTP